LLFWNAFFGGEAGTSIYLKIVAKGGLVDIILSISEPLITEVSLLLVLSMT
jgi:hypothetical protein